MEHGILLLSLRGKKTTRFLFHTYLSSSEARDADVIGPERLAYRAVTGKCSVT